MMTKVNVSVVNTGKRMRDRLGSRFTPNKEVILEGLNQRQYLTLKAVKDFKVTIIEEEKNEDPLDNNGNEPDGNENDENSNENPEDNNTNDDGNNDDGELDYYDLNVAEVIKAVEQGVYDVDEAIAHELAGKSRTTLLEKLEVLKQETLQQED